MLLLFAHGERPDVARVEQALENRPRIMVSHNPSGEKSSACTPESDKGAASEEAWLELLVDGPTFDCLGLAPGPGLTVEDPRHLYDLSGASVPGEMEAIGLTPGPHLSGAGWSLPVVRTLAGLGAQLLEEFESAVAAVWLPASAASSRTFFIQAVGDWIAGGPFPALGLAGIREGPGGELASDGLAQLLGGELHLPGELFGTKAQGARLLMRLADRLVGYGPVAERQELQIGEQSLRIEAEHSNFGMKVNVQLA